MESSLTVSMGVERSDLIVINLPKNMVTKLFAERFKLVDGIEVEQEFVDVLKVGGNCARQGKRIVVSKDFARFGYGLNVLDVLKTRQV